MKYLKLVAAGTATLSLLFAAPAASATSLGTVSAEKLRRLDIMLMVTSLRCRNGADTFQKDYDRFSAAHMPELSAAARTLRKDLERRHGPQGAKRALDRMSVSMANTYGGGHPSLGCRELKKATADLAANNQPGALLAAADELLDNQARVPM